MFLDLIITTMFLSICVYLMVAIGGVFSERSGIVNIALDGQMIFGGFGYCLTTYFLGGSLGDYSQIIGWVVAIVFGMLSSFILAFASITLGGNQIIAGLALNLFAAAMTMFIIKSYLNIDHIQDSTKVLEFSSIPVPIIITIIIIVIAGVFISKTTKGKRMISAGENPEAIASLGINVMKMRYIGVLVSGVLSGLGGAFFIQTIAAGRFQGSSNGLGFVSIAIIITGQWRIKGVFLGAILFGLISTISTFSSQISGLNSIPQELWMMAPYFITIIIMIVTAKNTQVPKASGQPFNKRNS